MKKILTLLVSILVFSSATYAQQFRWIKGGGSIASGTGLVDKEQLRFLTTDSNRNVYAASQVFGQNLKADTFYQALSNLAYNQGKILLTSYKCDGTMRWAKLLECDGVAYVYGMEYDGGANLYVSGFMNGGDKHFGNDTVVATEFLKSFLLKIDTLGQFKWVRFLGADNPQNQFITGSWGALALDGSGNIHHYADMGSGVQISPTITSIRGTYDLRYNSTGTLLGATRLGMDSAARIVAITLNKQTGRAYAAITANPSLGNTYPSMLAAFTPSGTALWRDTLNNFAYLLNLYYDGAGNIYSCGYGPGQTGFTIKNQTVTNTAYPSSGGLGVIVKVDTLGNVKWIYKCQAEFSPAALFGLTPMKNGRLFAAGETGGVMKSAAGTDSLVVPQLQGRNAYFTVVDTSGAFIQFGQLFGNGQYDYAAAATTDKQGSVIVGGQVEDSIRVSTPGVPPYKTNGGSSDFFLAKYGFSCNCTTSPVSSYNKTQNNTTRTVTFTYTGTTTGLDSLVWQWGNGQKLKVTSGYTTPVTFTYTGSGSSFSACAIAYSGCGTAQSCQQVQFPTSVGSVEEFANVMVYPNPTTDVLTIEGAELGTTYRLFSLVGQVVSRGTISTNTQTLSLGALPAGTYMLTLTSSEGVRGSVRVTKR